MKIKLLLIFLVMIFSNHFVNAQDSVVNTNPIDYTQPKDYILADISIKGIKFLSKSTITDISALKINQIISIPGNDISIAINKLWKQNLFSDIKIEYDKIINDSIYLNVILKEYPRLSKFKFKGDISKSNITTLKEDLKLMRGKVLTQNLIKNSVNKIRKFYTDKGYLNVSVKHIVAKDSTSANASILIFDINKYDKVKIKDIIIYGRKEIVNTNKSFFNNKDTVYAVSNKRLKKSMKETKVKNKWRFFKVSKFIKSNYEDDKNNIIEEYNNKGYRDAKIINDTTYLNEDNTITIEITLEEGEPYLFGDVNFIGNTRYTNEELSSQLGIDKGDVFNQSILDSRLFGSQEGTDISSLYLDDGYLFFNATPVEIATNNNTIDIEVRLYEGEQARLNKISVQGNTKTQDHVIMRELRTRPGDLFKRSDIMRSQRELAQMQYFDPEAFDVKIDPNPARNEVDITYIVSEKSSDQIQLQGGWGGGRVVGSLGLTFNNFSSRNIFNGSKWRPLPSGDGQRLSLTARSNGAYYQNYMMSFTEPWLGGKKPTSLSVSLSKSISSNGLSGDERQEIQVSGLSLGIGKRLKNPDDYFTLYNGLNFIQYKLSNSQSFFSFRNGESNNVNYQVNLGRNSVDQLNFPRQGSNFLLSIKLSPPYSMFDNVDDYSSLTDQEKYKWVEYYKWKFKATWFSPFTEKLILATKTEFGFLGGYNDQLGISPFERFYVGGDGLSGMGYMNDGRELVALRGYSNNSLSPQTGATIYNKYTAELRYALSLNPTSTMYALAFLEAGNAWEDFDNFNPFGIKRSVGIGVKIMLPMIGMMGLDYGWGLDEIIGNPDANGGQFHFSIGQNF
ncbi:MAG: outer membrane protein assembly factor BamA [Pelagibacterales bacterium]|nr:outer membrane protein assembly factor BamA [Pelagibacterales bacterium]